ncbi:ABC transporter permease [Anaerocolumna sp. MB42-C2]|uniref:ABC transporter permease n=1 Tax=Anaerocolumna sp. MB42-C2 TaxID=3070997 RepID=UPI0027DF17F1|nr:ABC transporter permease [Anaerocolumna sp. MB42-C2]WMJ86858.1 ABC transporter permease [Anaerocolumna sp. MB42-C2]
MGNKKNLFLRDTNVMLGRSMKHIFRSIDTIITVCITPIAIMLLMVYVFGGAMGGGMSTAEYVSYSLPGILLISISSAIAYTALRLFTDIKSGFFDRFKSMPISASSALWAHVLTSLVSNAMSLAVIFLVAFFMGFRSSAGMFNWLAVIGILALFTLALTWVAAIAGLKAKSVEGSSAFSYPLIFLPFISSAFLSTETMPAAVRAFAENQPETAIVDSIRALLMNKTVGNEIWTALAWCVGIMLVAWFFAMRAYRKI